MEIRIVVFLSLVLVYALINTGVFIAAYLSLSRTTSKITKAVSDFENNAEIKKWVGTMQTAALEAVVVTETTKQHLTEFSDALCRAQETYKSGLVKVDASLERVADGINVTAQKVKDAVQKPAASVVTFAAGIANALEPDAE